MRNFIEEFKKKVSKIDHHEPIKIDSLADYQVIKTDRETSKVIAFGLTKDEARIFVKSIKVKLIKENEPNEDRKPYFKLEIYKILLDGKELLEEYKPKTGIIETWID